MINSLTTEEIHIIWDHPRVYECAFLMYDGSAVEELMEHMALLAEDGTEVQHAQKCAGEPKYAWEILSIDTPSIKLEAHEDTERGCWSVKLTVARYGASIIRDSFLNYIVDDNKFNLKAGE